MSNLSNPVIAGWLTGVQQQISPHCDARPDGMDIDLIVIHAISLPPEQFGGSYINDLFLGRLDKHAHPYFEGIAHLKVSAHVLIRRNGDCIQYVPFHLRAWHAGQSFYQGRERCNDFSIGIELEGSDHQPFTEAQYVSLNSCIKTLLDAYPGLSREHIVGHSDIAPGRKTDPGPHFEWVRLE